MIAVPLNWPFGKSQAFTKSRGPQLNRDACSVPKCTLGRAGLTRSLQPRLPPRCYRGHPPESRANPIPPPDEIFSGFPFIQVQVWGHLPGPQSLRNLSPARIAKVVLIRARCIKCHVPGTLGSEWQVLTHSSSRQPVEWAPLFTPRYTLKCEEENVWAQVTPWGRRTPPVRLWDPACGHCPYACPAAPCSYSATTLTLLSRPLHPWPYPSPSWRSFRQLFPIRTLLRVTLGSSLIPFGPPVDFILTYLTYCSGNLHILMKLLFFVSVSSTEVRICWEINWHRIHCFYLESLERCLDHISHSAENCWLIWWKGGKAGGKKGKESQCGWWIGKNWVRKAWFWIPGLNAE